MRYKIAMPHERGHSRVIRRWYGLIDTHIGAGEVMAYVKDEKQALRIALLLNVDEGEQEQEKQDGHEPHDDVDQG